MKDLEPDIISSVALLKALANKRRLKIMYALSEGEKSVGELETIVGISQSALSQHLSRLRKEGIVNTRRSAQMIYYSTNNQYAISILKCLKEIFSTAYDGTNDNANRISNSR